MTAEPAVVTRDLTKRFNGLVAVDQVALSVNSGTCFGLLGSNGAGKSTTIKMLTTLLPPTSGGATVAGFDLATSPREIRRRIGYVPQLLSVDGALTAAENLHLFGALYGIARSERAARIEESLRFVGLLDSARSLVKTFSGGMIRRLEIAQAVLHRPHVLFLDEPTVGLDPVARHAVWDKLRELRSGAGTTIWLTTHDMEEAETLCDEVAIMQRGRVIATGAPAALEAQLGVSSMDEVFVHFAGHTIEAGGYRETAQLRQTARRLE
jgi:ABC-2 type transport system ATP-binding protein